MAQLEAEKREVERSALRLEKDRVALKRMLDKVGCVPRVLPSLPLGPSPGWSQLRVPRVWGPQVPPALLPVTQHPFLSCSHFLGPPSFPRHPDPLPLSPPRWNGRSFAVTRIRCG